MTLTSAYSDHVTAPCHVISLFLRSSLGRFLLLVRSAIINKKTYLELVLLAVTRRYAAV